MDVGEKVTLTRTVTEKDIESFGEISLDHNPVHFDDSFAEKTFFKKRIAHGMIAAALVSGCLTEAVGAGNIWLNANFNFQKPVYIGDTVSSTLTVKEVSRRGVITFEVDVRNQDDETVISGEVQSMKLAVPTD